VKLFTVVTSICSSMLVFGSTIPNVGNSNNVPVELLEHYELFI